MRLVLLLLLAGVPAYAAKPTPPAATSAPAPAKRIPSMEERAAAFGAIDEKLTAGDKAGAADLLLALTQDPTKDVFHAEGYARLAATLDDLGLPYAALLAERQALTIDAAGVSSVVKTAIEHSEQVGDSDVVGEIFAANVGLEVDADTRAKMAYLAARQAHRAGNYPTAAAVLKLIPQDHALSPEARALEGVVIALQGRHKDALAPLLMAHAMATQEATKRDAQFRNAVTLNIARSYYTIENFPRAIEYFAQVDRESPYWLEAQFERAWAHFRLQDMNGTIALLHTHNAPFFEDWYFPEGDLLRIYSLFLMCKFPEASKKIDEFQVRYRAQHEVLRDLSTRSPEELFEAMRAHVEGRDGLKLPTSVTRIYEEEDRFLDDLKAVRLAADELQRLAALSGHPFTAEATRWLQERQEEVIVAQGSRIKAKLQSMEAILGQMLTDSELSKLDMLQYEARLYERAANLGEMPEARRLVARDLRIKQSQRWWPWEGEYWADELGYYRLSATPECPAGLTPGGGG